jgi:hypothetical protein
VNEFNKAPVRSEAFEMTLAIAGRWPQLILSRKPGSGQAPDRAVRAGGDVARLLRKYKPSDRVVRFFVWPDGFEAYLVARQATAESGYAAGWELVTSPAEHQVSLNKYGIGAKPPPPPADQEKPPPANVLD